MPHITAIQLAMAAQESLLKAQSDLQQLVKNLAESDMDMGSKDRSTRSVSGKAGLSLHELRRGDYRYTKPSRLRLPNSSAESVKSWKEVVETVIGWLVDNRHIVGDVPLGGRRQAPIVSNERSCLSQSHGNLDSYISRHGDWWIDTWGNVNTKARNLVAICQSIGVDPAGFKVGLREGAK